MKPERILRLMVMALRKARRRDGSNPLAECDPMTLLGAMMTCASLGLEPNTVLGHAYLIPFGKDVTLIIGYKGMIDLARRSGHVVSIHADVVYEGDDFSYEYGSNQHLRHVPEGARQSPTHAYCHAKLTDGGEAFIVLPWDVVMAIRDGSQGYKAALKYAQKDAPWIVHTHQMARKTAVRALFNELPISVEKISDALQVDDRTQDFAAFAMDPTAGMVIEGEVVDPETGEVTEADDKPEPEKAKPKRRVKKSKPELVAEDRGGNSEPANEPDTRDFVKSLVLRVVDDLRSADEGGEIEATLELFKDQLDLLKETVPAAYDEIMEAADQGRERVQAWTDQSSAAEGEG